jgi:SAM-dependent methyltransferase
VSENLDAFIALNSQSRKSPRKTLAKHKSSFAVSDRLAIFSLGMRHCSLLAGNVICWLEMQLADGNLNFTKVPVMNYYLTAAALKVLSSHSVLRKAYRWAGNRKKSFPVSIPKPRWIWEQVVEEGVNGEGHVLLELGTGWVHAGSLYSALLIDASITAFDVWDCRSLYATKTELSRIEASIQMAENHSPSDKKRARERAKMALQAQTFDELYKILNITYVVDEEGVLPLPDHSVDMIYSQDVLEHVTREAFDASIKEWRRVLKPRGRFLALVGLDDHLAHYDKAKSMKEYLYHSDKLWDYLLSNGLQYINRLTATEIVKAFQRNGFEVEKWDTEGSSIDLAAVHPYYKRQTQGDLEATCLRLYARR